MFLLIILTIPLIHKSFQIDLYKVHNLLTLCLELGVQFSFVIDGHYLALLSYGLYVASPIEHDIQICMITQGFLGIMNQSLYPI